MLPPSTRSFVTLAFAAELAEDPALLAAYTSVFDESDDATLVVYAPASEEAAVVDELIGAASSVGLDLRSCADMVVFAPAGDQDSANRLMHHCHAVLSNTTDGRFGQHPVYTRSQVPDLRKLAVEMWSAKSSLNIVAVSSDVAVGASHSSEFGGGSDQPVSPRKRPWIDESVPGWMTRPELDLVASVAAGVPDNGVIVEVGSFAGRSSVHWAANSRPSVKIYCIDPFDTIVDDYSFERMQGNSSGVRGRTAGELFAKNTQPWAKRVAAIPKLSPPSSWDRPADVIFVDGDHTFAGVTRDIEFWIDQLKPGGRLLGHDFDDARVREAVFAFATARGPAVAMHPGTNIWELQFRPQVQGLG
jgi:precorrin-6B methylase 2